MRYTINICSVDVEQASHKGQAAAYKFVDINERIALIGTIGTWLLTFSKCHTLSENRKTYGDHLLVPHYIEMLIFLYHD